MINVKISKKWSGIAILLIGALVMVNVVVGSASADESKSRTLVLDAQLLFFTDSTSLMEKGERKYQENNLFAKGQSGISDPIGIRR